MQNSNKNHAANKAAQKGQPTRPQARKTRRRSLWALGPLHLYPATHSRLAWLTPIARAACFFIEQGGQGGTYCAHRASTLSTPFSNVPVCALCEQGPALTALPLLLESALREQAGQPSQPKSPSRR
jgi:hypothetical protein